MVNLAILMVLLQSAPAPVLENPTICIDAWRGDEGLRAAVEDALASALLQTKRFRITENCRRAAYVVKGSIVERADVRSRSEGESTGVGSFGVGVSRSASGAVSAAAGGSSVEGSEAISSAETRRQVTISAKLVNEEGEVLLATTQDSGASKGKSALTEASEKLAREISRKLFPSEGGSASSKIDKSGYVKVK